MVLFTAFFTLGIWLLQQQAVLPTIAWTWLLLALPLLLPAHGIYVRGAQVLLLAIFACGLGFFHAGRQAEQRLSTQLDAAWQGRDIDIQGVVAELPRHHPQGLRFRFDVEQTLTPRVKVPPHIYLSTYSDRQSAALTPKAGERWRLTVRLKQIHGSSNPHGFDFEAWALENKLRATGYVHPKGNNQRVGVADGFLYAIEAQREKIAGRFNDTLGVAPYAGVLNALAIGEQSGIPQRQWQVFTRTGVNHLMSISGLHITMLSGLAFALAYALWRRSTRLTLLLPARKAAALLALAVALGYALLSGFGIPAQRTVYMVAAVTVALWLNRNFSPGQILGIALLGVLIPDPWAVLSPGFWLSFWAVALIFYITAHRIGKSHFLIEYAKVQWAMTIGLTPLLLALFQQVSLVSPVANALAIPLVGLIVVPLTLLGAAIPFEWPLWLAHLIMDATMMFLEWLNRLPQAVWMQHAPPAWSIASGILGVLWILLPRGFPARWLGVLFLLPLFLNKPDTPAENSLRMIVFDVGQGLAVVAQTRQHALLYDTGPDFSGEADSGNRILLPALRAFGIARLDGLILSHDDIDHTGGASSVMQAMPVAWVSSSLAENHPLTRDLADSRRCADGDQWQWDGVNFEILHPDHSPDVKKHDNDLSCVLRISIGERHILLTADIEKRSEQRLLAAHPDKLAADLLVVPHHGSKSSSSREFIAAVRPQYAIFTVAYRNRYGHPKQEVVQRYASSGAVLARSDRDGAMLIEMNANQLTVGSFRKTHRRYWSQ